jgi:putative two-component system response regulator
MKRHDPEASVGRLEASGVAPDITRKQSILCIDNEPRRLSELGGILGEHYRLHFARDAINALSAARKLKPSLILLDTRVPEAGGLELCRRLKDDPATRALPIVLVMDAAEAVDERAYVEAGGVAVLVRPLVPVALLARISGLLSNMQAMS